MKLIDLTGRRFGQISVIGIAPTRLSGQAAWRCVCDCGRNMGAVRGGDLRNGHTTSCGHSRYANAIDATRRVNRSHGMTDSRVWTIWHGMLQRCSNPVYARYAGRGIKVCDRWRSFAQFLDDMGEPPPGTSIDRIDNDGDYEPTNCRWATMQEQQKNRSTTRLLTLDGRTLCLTDWARSLGMSPASITSRLERGWPIDAALTTPPNSSRRRAS